MTDTPKRIATGLPVDSSGGATVDPTENVKALVLAEKERSDDIRTWQDRFFHAQNDATKELATIRAQHADELRRNDTERYAAIRQVDIINANAAAAQIQTAIQTLAKSSSDTASALAKQLADRDSRIDERIGLLERNQSLGEGKQRVADPQLAELVKEMREIAKSSATGSGSSMGMEKMYGWIIAALAILWGIFGKHIGG